MTAVLSLLAVLLAFGFVLMLVVKSLLHICAPNEVLIFSGGQRAAPNGRKVGYRIIKGGRAIRIPLFETVDRMDLTNMPIEVQVQSAYSKGGIPLNVHGIANVKVAGEQPVLDNAIERFLGVGRDKIMAVAKETLEGNLRGVLATLTPEEVNEDKIKFAQSLLDEAEDDLRRLGL
jgi:flotillin